MHTNRVFHIASNKCSEVCRKSVKNINNSNRLVQETKSPTSSDSFKTRYNENWKLSSSSVGISEKKIDSQRFVVPVIFERWNNRIAVKRFFSTSPESTILPEMPEARGLPLVGTTLSLIRAGGASRLHEYVDKRHDELGPIYRENMGSVKAVFVSSPDEYRRIFRLEGNRPKHLLPEAWILYNEMRKCRRGLFFM